MKQATRSSPTSLCKAGSIINRAKREPSLDVRATFTNNGTIVVAPWQAIDSVLDPTVDESDLSQKFFARGIAKTPADLGSGGQAFTTGELKARAVYNVGGGSGTHPFSENKAAYRVAAP